MTQVLQLRMHVGSETSENSTNTYSAKMNLMIIMIIDNNNDDDYVVVMVTVNH